MKAEKKIEDTPLVNETVRKKTIIKENPQKNKQEKLQPLREQLRIAQLLDNGRREDPRLKEKLKEVMDATKKSLDEAYIALHDSDFDPNKAVTLLLEGVCTQWSTLPKKKRNKTLCPKQQVTDGKTVNSSKQVSSAVAETSTPEVTNSRPAHVNRRGRGRGSYRGDRNQERQQGGHMKKKIYTSQDNDSSKLIETRYFEQRPRGAVVRPEDTWDQNHPVSDPLSMKRNDLDEEEYTGSLSTSLVITSSSFGKNTVSSEDVVVVDDLSRKKCDGDVKLVETEKNIVLSPEDLPKLSFHPRAPPATASVLKGPPRVDKVVTSPKLLISEKKDEVILKSVPSPIHVEKTEKIPLNAVEMPPSSESNKLLDITFGAIDLNEPKEEETVTTIVAPVHITEIATVTTTPEKVVDSSRTTESVRDITSTFYGGTSLGHNSSRVNRPAPRNVHCTYNTDVLNAMYQNSATFTAAPTAQSVCNSGITPVHYSNYTTTQPLQIMPNFQGVMTAQTYTSNSQYATLPSTPYIPYASYSSMVQSQKLTNSSFKELDGTASGNYSLVTDGQTTKSSTMTKNSVLSSMPVVGHHQIILNQGSNPYYQPNHLYHAAPHTSYQEMQLIQQQQRLSSHYSQQGHYYDMPYSTANSTREPPPAFPAGDRFLPHTTHLQASNDHTQNMIYGTDFNSHYGQDSNTVKSFMQQQGPIAIKSQTKVNTYE